MEKISNKESVSKEIIINLYIAVAIMIYFICINFTYKYIEENTLKVILKAISIVYMVTSIVIFEIAYKKDNGKLAIYGIEALVIAIHALLIIHICTICKFDFQYYILSSSYIFAIYYVLKDIILYTIEKKKYLDNLSDIPEIVKKEEPKKKEATKKRKEVK